jgi:hypothetical protein
MHELEICFSNDDIVLPMHAEVGTVLFKFVIIDDAISDLS